jgi:putative ABC transport system permease protein
VILLDRIRSIDPDKVHHLKLVAELAARDYRHDWIMSTCYVLALAAVLMPLLVLFGLKFGIISNLLEPIKQDPRYREIVPVGSGNYPAAWFAAMDERSDVVFVIPKTRAIAATMKIRVPDSEVGRIIDVEMIPSAPGDPSMGNELPGLSNAEEVILSASAADRLGAQAGTQIEGIVSRTRHDKQETELIPLTVIGVAPPGAFSRNGVFVTIGLLTAVEDFRDGRILKPGPTGEDADRVYAGFRLFADDIDDVETLRAELARQGVDVRTKSADIELVRSLDTNLSIVYWVIALVSIGGFCLSFGASLWANIDRKKGEFSVLRMVGFHTQGIVWFPLLQALFTGVLGWLLASIAYFVVQGALNAMFMDNLGAGQSVCRLLPGHLLLALLLTLAAAITAAVLGGARVARMEPSSGLRSL